MFESLKLGDLPKRQCRLLRKPSSTRPALWVIEEDRVRAVVKDYSSNSYLYRNTIGRFLVWRESKAYRRLKGLRGLPAFYRTIDGLALVLEELPGMSIEGLEKREKLSESFFKELQELVKRVHRRGLAHCDLKRAPNILIGLNKEPYIVDWCASISEREFRFFPVNRIYNRFLQDDLNAITKIQLRHCPEAVSPEQKRRYYRLSKAEKLIRTIRDRLRELLQRIA